MGENKICEGKIPISNTETNLNYRKNNLRFSSFLIFLLNYQLAGNGSYKFTCF